MKQKPIPFAHDPVDSFDQLTEELLPKLGIIAHNMAHGTLPRLAIDSAGIVQLARVHFGELAERHTALCEKFARLDVAYDRSASGADDRDEPEDAAPPAPAAAGARCRHEWAVDSAGGFVCKLCGKPKGKQGRKPADKSGTVTDPPSAPLPGVVPGDYTAPPVEAERGTLRTVGAVNADKFTDGGMGSSGRASR